MSKKWFTSPESIWAMPHADYVAHRAEMIKESAVSPSAITGTPYLAASPSIGFVSPDYSRDVSESPAPPDGPLVAQQSGLPPHPWLADERWDDSPW